ncbi:MAG TPA: RNA polymerase sigma factor RpoD/SigA [bacterium]|nr:RNA polymerase sigma factor RpoD/SigA [bacterium]
MKKQAIYNGEKDNLSKYFSELNYIPQLSSEEEFELARDAKKGDRQALKKLVSANLKFVVFIARDYQDRGLPLDDLISEGNVGLIEAAKRFDYQRGVKFISYAVWWIRQSILRALANYSRLVRLPINHVWGLQRMLTVIENLEQHLGRSPELEEVATELNISPDTLSQHMIYWGRDLSLDDSTYLNSDNLSLLERVGSNEFAEPSRELLNESLKTDIRMALDTLPERECKILKWYYGIEQERPLTLLEIGDLMNLSRERIRQIKNRALRKLRYINQRENLQHYLG